MKAKKQTKEIVMKENKRETVEIQPIEIAQIAVTVVGDTPLLMGKMSMDVVDAIENKKADKMTKKDKRMEEEKVDEKIHHTEDGNIGFPATAFAKGMIEVAPYIDGLDKKRVRGSIRVIGNVIPIDFKKQTTNIAVGRSAGMTKAPRKIIRPEFRDWSCKLQIRYNKNNISAEQIVNLLNWAGFQQGVGSWRPETGGSYGQYHVKKN